MRLVRTSTGTRNLVLLLVLMYSTAHVVQVVLVAILLDGILPCMHDVYGSNLFQLADPRVVSYSRNYSSTD